MSFPAPTSLPVNNPRSAVRRYCLWCMGGHEGTVEMADGTKSRPYRPAKLVEACDSKLCRLRPIRGSRRVPRGRSTRGLIRDHCFSCMAGEVDKVKWGKATYTRARPMKLIRRCQVTDCALYAHRL